jgi:DNA-binding MarR family transcriptional regulator
MAETGKSKPANHDQLADPANSIGYMTRIAFRSFSRAMERRTLRFGVSGGQWRFLRQLWVEDGLTQRELSRRVGMREPTTVTAVNSLVRSGFAERVPSVKDRRKIHIHLTQKAIDLQAELLPLVAEVNVMATANIEPADLANFRKVLNQIAANLAAEAEETLVSTSDEA